MAGDKILLIAATGPSGLCLIRELLHRKHATVVFARNPGKLPDDLVSNALLEVVQGELQDHAALSKAVAQAHTVISLLGPVDMRMPASTMFADFYREGLFPLMRQHGVRRVFASAGVSIYTPEDHRSLVRAAMVTLVRTVANGAYQSLRAIGEPFEEEKAKEEEQGKEPAGDTPLSPILWTVFRVPIITGGSDAASWEHDRDPANVVYSGPIGAPGCTSFLKRGAMARWLVDAAESGAPEWVGKMPAISQRG